MSTTPLDLVIAAVFAARRFGITRTFIGALLTAPVWLYSLPPISCGCLPSFRRCTRAQYFRAVTKYDLKDLASQQEIHFADHGTYSYDTKALGFVPSGGVELSIVASAAGWAARARHEANPEHSCAIFVGDAAGFLPNGDPSAVPGEVTCTE